MPGLRPTPPWPRTPVSGTARRWSSRRGLCLGRCAELQQVELGVPEFDGSIDGFRVFRADTVTCVPAGAA